MQAKLPNGDNSTSDVDEGAQWHSISTTCRPTRYVFSAFDPNGVMIADTEAVVTHALFRKLRKYRANENPLCPNANTVRPAENSLTVRFGASCETTPCGKMVAATQQSTAVDTVAEGICV